MNKLAELSKSMALVFAVAIGVMGTDFAGAAQLNVHHYDTRDGIPQIQVTSVHQDRAGYLWVGTYGGLARCNGREFTVFGYDSGLSTSYINVVDCDSEGVVWVGTARGLCRMAGGRFSCFNPSGMDQLMVNDILIDDDRVWVAADESLYRYADGALKPAIPTASGAKSRCASPSAWRRHSGRPAGSRFWSRSAWQYCSRWVCICACGAWKPPAGASSKSSGSAPKS